MNRHVIRVAKYGAADSKYFSNPQQLEKDIEQNKLSAELFKIRVREMLLEEPSKLDIRYHQAIEVLREIKEEFRL